ncbi:MAG: serine/threonine protein kinase [Magnetococcales bacterium]|nr:serine/threonine protein kinase [Magnetococcales bacterium]MBF0437901.1 serine/threonine protein kinase [Magnetococcales bacterium]
MELPEQICRYRIDGILGQGATGIVYQGFDPKEARPVAIKTIPFALWNQEAGRNLAIRLRREALVVKSLSHANVTLVYLTGEEMGVPFLVMELHHGQSLKELILTGSRPSRIRCMDIMLQTLAGLGHIHAQGIVHGDIKPANIMLLMNGQVKITDFSAAHFVNDPTPSMNKVTGTHGYMAPEQLMGQRTDLRADLFAAGVILHVLLTGVKPFVGNGAQAITRNILTSMPSDPTSFDDSIPAPFYAVIKKALAKQPRDRFQNAETFQDAIKMADENLYSHHTGPHL